MEASIPGSYADHSALQQGSCKTLTRTLGAKLGASAHSPIEIWVTGSVPLARFQGNDWGLGSQIHGPEQAVLGSSLAPCQMQVGLYQFDAFLVCSSGLLAEEKTSEWGMNCFTNAKASL